MPWTLGGRTMRTAVVVATGLTLAGLASGSIAAEKKSSSWLRRRDLKFPFFVHMMKMTQAEGEKLGVEILVGDGQVSSTKQTADIEAAITKKADGILADPNEVDAWRRPFKRPSTRRFRS
jgi:inositol transport system substrate-binding protein